MHLRILLSAIIVIASWGTSTGDDLLPPEQASSSMRVPDGFNVTLFAGEPDVRQPIGFCIDDRGRLWVAEAYNYPVHGTGTGDRIVILDDVDGDGRFDKRSVFYDRLNYVTGIEVGFGGVWVMSPPNFYFIPDRDGDDRPDGPPQVLLDGFGNHANAHNLANGFAWGPDGWLYGTHGRTNWSMIGKPGAPEDQRTRFDGGVYRYHPVRHVWEPFADGTTNPWGIDWDDYGQAFICNCVNPHLFHVIQGAHYEPWRNRKSSQYAYRRIPTIADHLHFLGGGNIRAGIGSDAEIAAGGGHAHCGMMVYLGDNWPDQYRNTVFMNNIHGRRINNDKLQRKGSGFTASHAPDVAISTDPWFIGVTLAYGPDGAVYVSDWSDTGECHSVRNTQRQTGRIFKISYGTTKPFQRKLDALDDSNLVQLQLHRNDWHVRHARRLLQERSAAGHDMTAVHQQLLEMFDKQPDVTRKLRALWALHVTGGADKPFLVQQLNHPSEYVRAWCVQLLCEEGDPSGQALTQFVKLAASGDAPLVRLYLASALQRLDPGERWPVAGALIPRSEDAEDQNLPLMYWYAIEPLVHEDVDRFAHLAVNTDISLIRQHIARRAASLSKSNNGLAAILQQISHTQDAEIHRDLLDGVLLGIQGRRRVEMPNLWPVYYELLRASDDSHVRQQALRLAVMFDDPRAITELRDQVADRTLSPNIRERAIETLIVKKLVGFDRLLLELIDDPNTQRSAIRGLAHYNHPETVSMLLSHYEQLDETTRQDVIQTLASRAGWAMKLLDAVESKQIPNADISALTARQIVNMGNPELIERVTALWGEIRSTPAAKSNLIADYKAKLSRRSFFDQADLNAGREIYNKNCSNCHQLFGAGEDVGPDLTGAQRGNLDYMLENLVDPSAAVSNDFMMSVFETVDGRVITGLVIAETEKDLVVQSANEKLIVPIEEIEDRRESRLSVMPEGLLQDLSIEQIRDLLAYIASPNRSLIAPTDATDNKR